MNRREFLRTTSAALSALLVPTWTPAKRHPTVDLAAFCAEDENRKYTMTAPFIQHGVVDDEIGRKPWQQKLGLPGAHMELFRYGTDGRICVRVPSSEPEIIPASETKLPPAGSLPYWKHGYPAFKDQWKPWPKQKYLLAQDSRCPVCRGKGVTEPDPEECEACQGMGWEVESVSDGFACAERPCKSCRGTSYRGTFCKTCNETGRGMFLGVQAVGCAYIDTEFDAKIRAHLSDVEYLDRPRWTTDPIIFRAAGAQGLLMPLDDAAAKARLA